jgi:hypothetical protein
LNGTIKRASKSKHAQPKTVFEKKKLIITEKLGKKRSYLKLRESTTGR